MAIASRQSFRPHVRDPRWHEERVAGIISLHKSGLPEAMETIRRAHPRFASATDEAIRAGAFTEDDARLVLAREHGFDNWEAFTAHLQALKRREAVEPFADAFEAIQRGDTEAVSTLIDEHADLLQAQGTHGTSLLNLAVSFNQPAICRLLLDKGADVNLATTRGVTPFHAAAGNNNIDLIDMLIAGGASPEACAYGDGGTPLVMALFWGHVAAAETLAQRAIVPNNLRVASGLGRMDLLRECFTEGGDLTPDAAAHRAFYRPHTGFPVWNPSGDRREILSEAFTYAARNGRTEAMDFLLAQGADINGDPYRGTALTWGVYRGNLSLIDWLLERGADANFRGTFGGPQHGEGFTALHAAAESGQFEIARSLLARGADPAIRDAVYGATAAGWAEYHDHSELEEFLKQAAVE